jgi:hypothetical protein
MKSARITFLVFLSLLLSACASPLEQLAPTLTANANPALNTAAPAMPTSQPTSQPNTHTPLPAPSQPPTQVATNSAITAIFFPLVTASVTPDPVTRFAIIGDYGSGEPAEARVASLVLGWAPDLIITLGDNNYPDGEAATIDTHVGQFYHSYIHPYTGQYGAEADRNRFFPTLGNHDWNTLAAQAYLDYFELPGNERYYDFTWGGVHFFALDSDSREPDGVSRSSPQAAWLQDRLQASMSPWKIVFMHHSAYSSGIHGPVDWMRWPFEEWGASAVLAGHDHTYERLQVGNLPYFINGLGGGVIYAFAFTLPESQFRYNADHGAMLAEASPTTLTFWFYNVQGELIDSHTLNKNP